MAFDVADVEPGGVVLAMTLGGGRVAVTGGLKGDDFTLFAGDYDREGAAGAGPRAARRGARPGRRRGLRPAASDRRRGGPEASPEPDAALREPPCSRIAMKEAAMLPGVKAAHPQARLGPPSGRA